MGMEAFRTGFDTMALLDNVKEYLDIRQTGAIPFDPAVLNAERFTETGGEVESIYGKGTLGRLPEAEPFIFMAPLADLEHDDIDSQIVHPNKRQPRKVFDPEEMDKLASSLRDKGQMNPVHVVPYLVRGRVRLITIDGESRTRALKAIGATHVKVKVHWVESDAELFELSLILNLARSDHNPIEKAEALEKLMGVLTDADGKHKMSAAAAKRTIAEKLKMGENTIENFMDLLYLKPRIREMILKKEILPTYAGQLVAKLKKLEDTIDQDELYEQLKHEIETKHEHLRVQGVDVAKRVRGVSLNEKDVSRVIKRMIAAHNDVDEVRKFVAGEAVSKLPGAIRGVQRELDRLDDVPEIEFVELAREQSRNLPVEMIERLQAVKRGVEAALALYKKANAPDPLPEYLGKPDYVTRVEEAGVAAFGGNEVRYKIALLLAKASDADEPVAYNGAYIAEQVGCSTSALASHFSNLKAYLAALGLEIDDNHVEYYRSESGTRADRPTYRLKWLDETAEEVAERRGCEHLGVPYYTLKQAVLMGTVRSLYRTDGPGIHVPSQKGHGFVDRGEGSTNFAVGPLMQLNVQWPDGFEMGDDFEQKVEALRAAKETQFYGIASMVLDCLFNALGNDRGGCVDLHGLLLSCGVQGYGFNYHLVTMNRKLDEFGFEIELLKAKAGVSDEKTWDMPVVRLKWEGAQPASRPVPVEEPAEAEAVVEPAVDEDADAAVAEPDHEPPREPDSSVMDSALKASLERMLENEAFGSGQAGDVGTCVFDVLGRVGEGFVVVGDVLKYANLRSKGPLIGLVRGINNVAAREGAKLQWGRVAMADGTEVEALRWAVADMPDENPGVVHMAAVGEPDMVAVKGSGEAAKVVEATEAAEVVELGAPVSSVPVEGPVDPVFDPIVKPVEAVPEGGKVALDLSPVRAHLDGGGSFGGNFKDRFVKAVLDSTSEGGEKVAISAVADSLRMQSAMVTGMVPSVRGALRDLGFDLVVEGAALVWKKLGAKQVASIKENLITEIRGRNHYVESVLGFLAKDEVDRPALADYCLANGHFFNVVLPQRRRMEDGAVNFSPLLLALVATNGGARIEDVFDGLPEDLRQCVRHGVPGDALHHLSLAASYLGLRFHTFLRDKEVCYGVEWHTLGDYEAYLRSKDLGSSLSGLRVLGLEVVSDAAGIQQRATAVAAATARAVEGGGSELEPVEEPAHWERVEEFLTGDQRDLIVYLTRFPDIFVDLSPKGYPYQLVAGVVAKATQDGELASARRIKGDLNLDKDQAFKGAKVYTLTEALASMGLVLIEEEKAFSMRPMELSEWEAYKGERLAK